MGSATFIEAHHPTDGKLIACVDASARFTKPRLASGRLAALLAPFPDEAAARAALREAGALLDGIGK